jgi:hypothetical protein
MNLKDYLNYLKLSSKTKIKIIAFLSFLIFTCSNISAQVRTTDSNLVRIDTSKFVMERSAWGAVLRSAILPGLGQYYNQSYWKIPVVWGFLVYLGYEWKWNDNNMNLYSIGSVGRTQWRDQRDLFTVYIGLTYLLNLIDAYVDAHLFDFDISNDKFMGTTTHLSIKIPY